MADAPAFSAVVVTHNSATELTALLDSIDRHLDPRPQVIVVDAASADGTLDAAEGRAEVVALGREPRLRRGVNAGRRARDRGA